MQELDLAGFDAMPEDDIIGVARNKEHFEGRLEWDESAARIEAALAAGIERQVG